MRPLVEEEPRGIFRVLVATWPDGAELWRTTLYGAGLAAYALHVPSELEGEHAERDEYGVQLGDGRRAVVLYPTRVVPKSRKSKYSKAPDLTPKIRWVLWRLGFLPEGEVPHPLSPKNPWIGRFRQDDLSEILADVARLNSTDMTEAARIATSAAIDEGSGRVQVVNERELGAYGVPRGDLWPRATVVVPRRDRGGGGREYLKPHWWILESGLVGLFRWMADREHHPDWVFLPRSEGFRMWRESLDPGRLSISDEEAETFDLLGEPLPYTWPGEQLLAWASSRET